MKIKSRKLAIIGASGHGKVIADIASLNGYEEIVFYDDNADKVHGIAYPVIGKCCDTIPDEFEVFVAIGNADIRRKFMNQFDSHFIPTLIHPAAVIAEGVSIGQGTVIMAGTVVNPCVRIGKGCIINTCSSIDHDCSLGDYVHVAVGSHLCGTVEIGSSCWIGAGATVSNNITICEDCMIGAGAVVVKNIKTQGTYVGVPAHIIKECI
ncbi:MAG: acetyltransferase [Ruminococcus sp.]|nr:acetyltransferase [Ruminococcus sp.]